jgi:beta-galactosidase
MLKIYHDDQPHNLTHVFGMTYDQFTDGVNVKLGNGQVKYWMELLSPSTAKTLYSYDHSQWGSYSAITSNNYGSGTATYLGCYFDDAELLKNLLKSICSQAQITLPEAAYPVVIKKGVNQLGREVIYYFNYSDTPQSVVYDGKKAATLLLQSKQKNDSPSQAAKAVTLSPGDTLMLQDWDVAVLEV